jgi:hypothetical protein
MLDVRTTLTIDDDVAAALRDISRRKKQSFKAVVDETLRAGIAARTRPVARRYRVKPSRMGGVVPGVDLDKALALSDALESEGIARKLELRK